MKSQLNRYGRLVTLSVIVIILSISSAFSQNYNIRTFTTADGLSHNNVREMVFDSTGFLWIATWDGLNRYDGYEFRQYSHNPDDTTSLPFFSVNRVMVDGSDNLWILTDNGIAARLDRKSNTFIQVKKVNGMKVSPAPNMACDDNGNIWIISLKEVIKFDHRTENLELYKVVTPDGFNYLNQKVGFYVSVYNNKSIWLVGPETFEAEIDDINKEIRVKNSYRLRAREIPPERIIRNYDHAIWYSMYPDKTGKRWIFSNMGIFLINESTKEIIEFTGEVPFRDFTGRELFCWGSQTGGFSVYRNGADSIMHFPASESQLLKNLTFRSKDIMWYSNTSLTGNSLGITRMIFTPGYFHKYKVDTDTDKLPAVYSVTVDNQKRVWLGIRGRDHLVVVTPENKIIKKYTPASSLPGHYGPVRSLIRTSTGIWVGYFWQMLLFYDYKTDTFVEHKAGSNQYRAIEVRHDGKIYTGHLDLSLYDPVTRIRTVLMDSLSDGGNFRFVIGKDSILWGCLSAGRLIRYDPRNNSSKLFIQKNISNNTEDICPVEDGYLWLAMLGGGLVKYHPETGDKKVYTTSDGLSNNTVYSILRDRSGYIWASTDNGISRLNPATGIIKKFGPSEGLDIVEFNSGASFAGEDGRFYFGGMGGAVSFYPDSINSMETEVSDARIILSNLTVSGKAKNLDRPVYKSDTVILDQGEDNFHLKIATTDFASSDKTDYRFRLTGHDDNWIVTDYLNRNINYVNLKPGTYTLEIEATDRNGEWKGPRNLVVILKPFFYQRKVFFIGAFLFISGLILLIINLYIRNIRNKSRQVQDELRLQALRGQMNPHFIFNSLNSINYFISNNDKLSANRYIADFARLIRTILSNMGNDYVPITVEMDSVRDYLEIEHLRFGDKFDYKVELVDVEENENLLVFPGMIQPFIENAIWHGVRALSGRKGFISVRLSKAGKERLLCIIEDDGIGRAASGEIRKKSAGHKSRGIEIVTERLQIIGKMRGINYTLEISDLFPGREETGTRVKVDLPMKYVH